jgi:DNA-binding GntR family transcriptional regulator
MSEFTAIRADKLLLADEVFERIANGIICEDFVAGQRLRDAELALQLHVSRMPVREALQRLERVGMVEMLPSRFTRVTEVTPTAIDWARQCAGYQSGIVARVAVPRLSAADRQRTLELLAAVDAALEDPRAASKARRALYSGLSEAAGNLLHHRIMHDVEYALERNLSRIAMPDEQIARMRTLHRRLAAAIRARDGEAAERLVRAQHGL